MALRIKRKVGQAIHIGTSTIVRVVAMSPTTIVLDVEARAEDRIIKAELNSSPPTKRMYTISDDIGNTADYAGYSPVDAFMAFAKNWPFTIEEKK